VATGKRSAILGSQLDGGMGAALPVVANIYLLGFFSQLSVYFIYPALIAVCRAGALPRRLAACIAASLLGFLATAYTEFWPIGVGIACTSILWWPIKLKHRFFAATAAVAGSLLLTGAYSPEVQAVFFRVNGIRQLADSLSGWVPDGITWIGWGKLFFKGTTPWLELAGALIGIGAVLGILLQPAHRRWWWFAALAAPGALTAYFLLRPQVPVYATYKLLATFAPIIAGLAVLGLARAAGRFGLRCSLITISLLGLAGTWAVFSGIDKHIKLVRKSHVDKREILDKIWSARDYVEQRKRGTYLLVNSDPRLGAWLTYFARDSKVFCETGVLSDRRAPSESTAFRKIPADLTMEWLDLDRRGVVIHYEPSPRLSVQGERSFFEQDYKRVFVLGRKTTFVLDRPKGFPPAEREFVLEFGLAPLPGHQPCMVAFGDERGLQREFKLVRPTSVSIPVSATPGKNVFTLQVSREDPIFGLADENQNILLLQALSIEREASSSSPSNTLKQDSE
jgi:hypothetical protein